MTIDDNTYKRRSVWQDILQSFKANRKHSPADSVAAITTTTIHAMGSDLMEESGSASASAVVDPFHDINTNISANDPATSTAATTSPRVSTITAASIYSQASPTNTLPPIIYCPRERAELDFLRQRYPTAASGYTAYRLPPEGVTSPPSIAASLFSGSSGGGGGGDASSS
ncbi:hypothetical protein BGZ95_010552, partial [Linnemannia exigua]